MAETLKMFLMSTKYDCLSLSNAEMQLIGNNETV